MKLSRDQYKKLYERLSPPTPSYKNIPAAFLVGGALCALGEAFSKLYTSLNLPDDTRAAATSITMVFIGVALTAARVYEKIAKWAGAGTLVPITGFANSIASPAMEFKTDDRVIIGTSQKHHEIKVDVLV